MSEHSQHALEWAVGTVLRDGDTLVVVRCLDEESGEGASRQDILTTSRRNVGLLNGIADAFVKTVLQFCYDDAKQYTWPYYLRPTDEIGGFWAGFVDSIKSCLLDTSIFRSSMEGMAMPLRRAP